MNKKLLAQIKNEWRTNLWLGIELLLVSVVMWWIIEVCISCVRERSYRRGDVSTNGRTLDQNKQTKKN